LFQEFAMQKIVPHLWFDTQAVEAAHHYVATFPGSAILGQSVLSETPSGTVDLVQLSLAGYEFQFLSAGPQFTINPSVSFLVNCASAAEVDSLHAGLSPGGLEMMALGSYPFSPRYAWVKDRFGVSWQLMFREGPAPIQKIVPVQMFTGSNAGKAEAALGFYTSLFGGSVDFVSRYGAGMGPNTATMVNHGAFTLAGERFVAMDSALDHGYTFNEAVSYIAYADDQTEVDRLWAALSADPGAEACGWLRDRYGFSWQIVPRELASLMQGEAAPRVAQAFLKMKKLDLVELRRVAGR
jgi:predicted 3-demethylubiquinone-9 3-methyltransferase (glyoxalase superfamily)